MYTEDKMMRPPKNLTDLKPLLDDKIVEISCDSYSVNGDSVLFDGIAYKIVSDPVKTKEKFLPGSSGERLGFEKIIYKCYAKKILK